MVCYSNFPRGTPFLSSVEIVKGKGKGKFHPITGHEGAEVEWRYSPTVSLTLALGRSGWSTPRPGRFTPSERPGTRCIGGWVGPRAGLDGRGKSS
jgi:hypothetical protein